MFLALHAVLLASLVKVLIEWENPIVCASTYAGFCLALGYFDAFSLATVLARSAVSFGLGFAFFWTLNRLEPLSLWWLLLLPPGLLAVLLIPSFVHL